MTFSRWPPKLTTQVGCQKPLTVLYKLEFDVKSCGINQNVAFLLRNCIVFIFIKSYNANFQDGCQN